MKGAKGRSGQALENNNININLTLPKEDCGLPALKMASDNSERRQEKAVVPATVPCTQFTAQQTTQIPCGEKIAFSFVLTSTAEVYVLKLYCGLFRDVWNGSVNINTLD